MIIVWTVIAIVALVGGWQVIKLVIGLSYPLDLLARKVLTIQLGRLDVPSGILSDACLDELTSFARSPLKAPVRQNLESNLEGVALNVAWVCQGHEEATPAKLAKSQNIFWQIMAKHDPARFSLENLAETQARMSDL